MSGGGVSRTDGADVTPGADAEIAARIASAVHDPFRAVWGRHGHEVWEPLGRVLEQGAAAHDRAMDELASGSETSDSVGEALDRYRRRVANEVLRPLARTLRDRNGAAEELERALAKAAGQAEVTIAQELPALVRAPLTATALSGARGLGPWCALKRSCALALRPLVWRRNTHDVPPPAVARHHLARVVLPDQRRALQGSQRRLATWLGDLERAWSEWVHVVLSQPVGVAPRDGPTPGADASAASHARSETSLKAGRELQRRLRTLVDRAPWASPPSPGASLERCERVLGARVGVAGTFVGGASKARSEWQGHQAFAAGWDRWTGESAARLDLYLHLLEAQEGADGIGRRLVARMDSAVSGIDGCLDEIDVRLVTVRDRAAALGRESPALVDELRREQLESTAELGEVERMVPDPAALLGALTDAASEAVQGLEGLAARLPQTLVLHRIPPAGASVRKLAGPGPPVRLREAARQAFDELRRERIRRAPAAIAEAAARVHTVLAELREVSAYGYEAAIAELSEGVDAAEVHPAMVTNGLSRAAAKVDVARRMLLDALGGARLRVEGEVAGGMMHLVQRAITGRMGGRYLDARSRLAEEAARGWARFQNRLAEALRRGGVGLSWVRRRLWPMKRALGIGEEAPSRAEGRQRSLAAAEEVADKLPLLYRRLFSFEPLSDPRLLAGRDRSLAAVEASWHRWRAERGGALAVIAPPGAGITSFLNVVARRLDADEEREARWTPRERVRHEAELAARLADWLALGDAPDLDALGSRVLDAPRHALPRLFVLEGIEHLHLRVAGGSKLFEALVSFIRRTSPRVFWVLSMGSSAWQLVSKRCPACAADIERVALDSLTAEQLRHAVLARHRLSGLPLRYAEPRTGRELLRRKVRGLGGSEKYQELLESDYFHRLHRASLGSIRTALFYWLRSADFRSVEGSLLVRPLEALPPFMRAPDLDQSFALKAFLDHGTLTVAEYCEVVRGSAAEARHLFRAMGDLHVIEAVSGDGARVSSPPAPDARYRIRPLVAGAVNTHLRSLNILH